MRKLILPEAKSQVLQDGQTGPKWGLAEFLLEALLPLNENLSSVENCDKVFAIHGKLEGKTGPDQSGKEVLLTDSEHEFLLQRWQRALQAYGGPGGRIPSYLTAHFALYGRALFAAEPVQEESAPA